MEAFKMTTAESETVERAFYEAQSYESLMSVLCRQLNMSANSDAKEIIMYYAELCRSAQMKLKMAQDMVLSRHVDPNAGKGEYRFDFIREEVAPVED